MMMGDHYSLLGRPEHPIDFAEIVASLAGRTILVTGAAGTIGSAVAQALLQHHDGALTFADRDEARLYQLQERLGGGARYVIADVTREDDVLDALLPGPPDVVIHAAAYKHVPMLERHAAAAHRNNVHGTRTVLQLLHGVNPDGRFVLVSTDKAVEPTCVMGRTKREAELLTLEEPRTTVVRFGNVLGSSNSVVDIWLRQIERGEPITVTDPDMTRFFMTLREAAALVLSAAGDAAAIGCIVVPDMGEPVRMGDLAGRFMAAVGGTSKMIGARPGERQAERLVSDGETLLYDCGRYRIYCPDPITTSFASSTPTHCRACPETDGLAFRYPEYVPQ